MANTRTVDFLPEIFQTTANKQFLNATLDQLVQEPTFKKTQGFVGRRVGPGVNPNDYYVLEPNAVRTNYQLEPGVISLKPDTTDIQDAITYPGITDALGLQGAITNNSDRLYTSEYYTWDPFVNFDKFINYSQYYWLPGGPDSVDVYSSEYPLTDIFDVTRNTDYYSFSGVRGKDPLLTLVRGGNYTFNVNQSPNSFWIQAEPGVSGRLPYSPNISSRDVLGVTNNGTSSGTVTFNVPLKNAQQFYYDLNYLGPVDLVTNLKFDQINGIRLDLFIEQYGGIDGITSLDGRTLVFTNEILDPTDGGWLNQTLFDPLTDNATQDGKIGSYDSIPFSYTTDVPVNQYYNIWRISYVNYGAGTYLQLNVVQDIAILDKFNILYGDQYASTQWYKLESGFLQQIPLLTAANDFVWYQDGTNPEIFGRIRLIDEVNSNVLDIDTDILGKQTYTSPNGVVFTNNLKVRFIGSVTPSSYQNQQYYVAGVGTAIQLLPIGNYVTPETYTQSNSVPFDILPFDVGNYDASLNQPLVPDYMTIALDSPDLNAWTRSNRWFHIDVITASSSYNNTSPILDNAFRAKRPILEFRGGLKLFDMGTQSKQPVNIIDFQETDAFSNINGSTGYSTDGYNFITGSRVIFAADIDEQVRNKIYLVEFIEPDHNENPQVPIINLVPTSDSDVLINQNLVCLSGLTLQGKSFYYDGNAWIEAQEKTSTNQPPLYDIFDADGISLSNSVVYPSSTFVGTKLFSYAIGTGVEDTVLSFPLKYLSLNNVGDILFNNNFYTDTFIFVRNQNSNEQLISQGFVREYVDRTIYGKKIGWQTAATTSNIYQQFSFVYAANTPLQLDVAVRAANTVPSIKVYVDSAFQSPGSYSYTTTSNTTVITFPSTTVIVPGQIIEVLALSDQVSSVAFYQVPINLEKNPLNQNSKSFTLGTVRTHYETIAENLLNFSGKVNGANNSRDLGNIIPFGLNILQQSSPMTLAGYFLRNPEYNIFASIEYNSREYEKYKAKLLNTAVTNDYVNLTVPEILTAVITDIISGRTSDNSFYWSDMLPASNVYTTLTTTVTPITTQVFDTTQIYNYTSANYLGLLVYINDVLLTRDKEYVVATDGPRLTILLPLSVGDTVTIQEYTATYGTFVPNTPTKLGLYPKFEPAIYLDKTYVTPTLVIRGHDGSITVAFNDFRDQLLLEFETRIYNNLKLDGNPVPLVSTDIIPGQFRTTDYSLSEITDILSKDFLTWVGWNKLDYKTQNYIADNAFTWNYSSASNKLNNTQPLVVGAWRGIYDYFYDTITPNTTPWEMLGLDTKPLWWETEYGPAPYTSGNLNLWDDLALGLVRDPLVPYVVEKYKRPGLANVIPADSEGGLLPPIEVMVGNYNSVDFKKSWAVGDDGPVENAWRTSSAYPFAIMRMLALTRPAEFFSLFADRDLYKFDVSLNEYLYNGRYRLDANGLEIYGNGVSKASYIDWIVDYNRLSGINSTDVLTADLKNLDVRLCYRMASFTGKNLLEIYTEKSSPNSLNSSLLLPDDSYNLLFYKNVPFDQLTYSSVIVQSTTNGWAVYGYSATQPYFNVLASLINGNLATVSAGGFSVKVPVNYSDTVVQIPYGYVFTNRTLVADFLLSYGALLQKQGLVFNQLENGYVLDWNQMVSEFLYWSGQGWAVNSIINLNPGATKIIVEKPEAIVDSIALQTVENMVLNADRTPFNTRDLVVERLNNTFTLRSLSNETINFFHIKFTSYENMVVLDNRSIFADLLYEPVTGARQSRVRLIGTTSVDWNGQLNAPGFILNQDNIKEWMPNRRYARGEIVSYKNYYYSAVVIVQPKVEFDFNDWVISDYTRIQQGLLPNLPNKSDQLANSYDIYNANLELNQDLFSFGLIGFKPREYMVALNLDSISQINLYKQFLGTKGTIRAAEIFTLADLGRGAAEYNIYENWAVQRAVYGANANRSYYEMQLNEALLTSNPSTIQVIVPGETSIADQTVFLSKLWNESYKLPSPDILTTTFTTPTDVSLPSAGYVNINDVDVTVFDLRVPTALDANIDEIIVGTNIWVAKINNYDWGIYRTEHIYGAAVQVNANLNGTSVVTFANPHGLVVDDTIVIRFFSSEVDGVYRVLGVPLINQITIAFTFLAKDQIVETGDGIVFKLQSQRVAQASDINTLPYSNYFIPGSRVWVDDNGEGLWEVLEKQEVFTSITPLVANPTVTNSNFGASIAQANNNLFALIGSPNYSAGGGIYLYGRTDLFPFGQDSNVIEINATGVSGFGSSVSIGNRTWVAAGAPNSTGLAATANAGYAAVLYVVPDSGGTIVLGNLLTAPVINDIAQPAEFGRSVVVSPDEKWMYIGAPGVNKVFAYGLVEVATQTISYNTNGTQSSFNYNNAIDIDLPQQLTVILNNDVLTYGVDYTLGGGLVVLTSVPPSNLVLKLVRRPIMSFTGNGSTRVFSLNEYLYSAVNIYSFQVTVDGVVKRPNIDYEFDDGSTIQGRDLIFNTAPAPGAQISVLTSSYYTFVDTLEFSVDFTASIAGTTMTVTSVPAGAPALKVGMKLSGVGVGATTEIISFGTGTGGAGTYYVSQTQTISSRTVTARLPNGAKFGQSVSCTTDGRQVLIGAPGDYNTTDDAGAVYVFDRTVQKFIVTDADTLSYPVTGGNLIAPTSVILNNTFLTNTEGNIGGEFSVTGDVVTLDTTIAVGDVLEIEVNTFNLIQVIGSNQPGKNANYGSAVDMCIYNCSLYVGAPLDSSVLIEAGSVERQVNQSRVYGTITSTINATLTPGNTIRINDMEVTLSTPSTWTSVSSWTKNTIVKNGSDLYIAVASVPINTAITNTTYWQPSSWAALLAQNINSSTVPNVTAFAGVSGTANFGLLTVQVKNTTSAASGNKLTVLPGQIGTIFGSMAFETFVYTQTITSPAPLAYANFGSAVNVDSLTANTLSVGAPNATLYRPNTFDTGTTYFDGKATTFNGPLVQSGAVYTYDYFASAGETASNPGKFAFGQQVRNSTIETLDKYGTAIDYTGGFLLASSPKHNGYGQVNAFENANNTPAWNVIHVQQPVVDVTLINSVFTYDKLTSAKTQFFDFFDPLQGKILGVAQQNINYIGAIDPAAYNVGTLNNYGKIWAAGRVGEIWWDTNSVRFINPNQDDIVYAARRWGQTFPGSTVEVYEWIASSVPPGSYTGEGVPKSISSYSVTSSVGVDGILATTYYFWVRGITSINQAAGKNLSVTGIARYIENPRSSGIPYVAFVSASATAIYNSLDNISAQDTILSIEFDRELTNDNVHVQYELIPEGRGDGFLPENLYRKLQDSFCGADTIGNRVPDPLLSPSIRYGVQFRPRQSMFVDRFLALKNYLSRVNEVLARFPISETRSFSLLNSSEAEPQAGTGAWDKRVANLEELSYQDFVLVPAGYLYLVVSDSSQHGFWTIYEVTAAKTFETLLLTRVQNYDTQRYWNYINWYLPGYNSSTKVVIEVPNTANLDTLSLYDAPLGSSVQVTANSQGKYEIYLRSDLGWVRVGLEDGTIAFSSELWDYALGKFGFDVEVFDAQYYDQEPVTETRKIIQAINEELLIGDLLVERNHALILVFNFILSELEAPEWLVKTSLVDIDHKIRQLLPYQIYQRDNQDFVVNYVKEVKPYHTVIREINLIYDGFDFYQGAATDFDLPAFYNTTQVPNQFMSPILTPYDTPTALGTGRVNTYSDVAPDSALWTVEPYNQWFANYTLNLEGINLSNAGSGYSVEPLVIVGTAWTASTSYVVGQQIFYDASLYTVTQAGISSAFAPTFTSGSSTNGTTILTYAGEAATAVTEVSSAQTITNVVTVNPGSGYISTPTITFTGGNGAGGRAAAIMGNNLVRDLKTTIKYDRYQYYSDVIPWSSSVTYSTGTMVRYDDRVWQANQTVSAGAFDPDYWTLLAASTLSGVDRTMGLYVPTVNEPGLDLQLLIDGISYPGVQVSAPGFDQNTGFDVGGYDKNPFDDIFYGLDGTPTYYPGILDAIYRSSFADQYLGTRYTDINVDGGEFLGPYESHAPEELVPGAEFDTMDFRVYTRPITTYTGDGVTTGPYNVPPGSVEVEVCINNAVINPENYTLTGSYITFDTAPANGSVIVILEVDPATIALEFRIFQDMRGIQATYRMTESTTTELTQDLSVDDDIIYLANASTLAIPDFNLNLWGVLTVNGERIMYREINFVDNTVSSLRRGTAGTAIDSHSAGTLVYNLNRGNLLIEEYQDYYDSSVELANGTTTVYSAPLDVIIDQFNADFLDRAILVYVGGILQELSVDYEIGNGFDVTPYGIGLFDNAAEQIIFYNPPPDGREVLITVRRGSTWYQAGEYSPSNGVALEYTNTKPAQFFKGL